MFVPEEFEFWEGGVNGLDDRVRFRKPAADEKVGEQEWIKERLI